MHCAIVLWHDKRCFVWRRSRRLQNKNNNNNDNIVFFNEPNLFIVILVIDIIAISIFLNL